ncbi:C1GALT1 [Symbiodinium microadriaticum]|nr:C1GALT1 [Symbiodinium microadriaticum]
MRDPEASETAVRGQEPGEVAEAAHYSRSRRLLRLVAVGSSLVFTCLVLYALTSNSRHTHVGTVTFEARAEDAGQSVTSGPSPAVPSEATPPPQTPATAASTTSSTTIPPRPSGVLYVLRSGHQNYKTRIPAVMGTWGQEVNSTSDGLIMIGDVSWPSHRPPIIPAEICGNDHSRQLCCKTGYALMMAAKHLEEFSWFFVVDDDMYVNLENSRQVLSAYDPKKLIALGIPGCGGGLCSDKSGGFCGGGGYAISQASLRKLMAPSPEAFHKDLMKNLAVEKSGQAWDDISISCSLKRHGIELRQIRGLHGWRLPGKGKPISTEYERAIKSKDPLPITFHYLTSDMMHAIHDRFQKMKRKKGPRLLSRRKRSEANYRNAEGASQGSLLRIFNFLLRLESGPNQESTRMTASDCKNRDRLSCPLPQHRQTPPRAAKFRALVRAGGFCLNQVPTWYG